MKNQSILFWGFVMVILFTIAGCQKAEEGCVEQVRPDCICTMQYDPVCGCNNKTYGNSCVADCAGVNYTKGACN